MNTPEKVINWLLNEGIITEDQAELLKSAYIEFSPKDEEQIELLIASGLTRAEAIDTLKRAGKLSSGDENLKKEMQATISETAAELYANQLYDAMYDLGTDDEQMANIMNDENLTAADWVLIISKYNEIGPGSFIQDIDGDFSGETQKKYESKVAEVLIEAVEQGDEAALDLLCKEFYNGTAGMLGTTDEFIEAIFANASEELLAKMYERYSEVNTGRDIIKDIKGDFSFSTEDKYIRMITEAYSKYR